MIRTVASVRMRPVPSYIELWADEGFPTPSDVGAHESRDVSFHRDGPRGYLPSFDTVQEVIRLDEGKLAFSPADVRYAERAG